jgi:glucose-6-phosphate 1-dehydrogenase
MKVQADEKSKFEEFFKLNHYVQGSYDKTEDFRKLNDVIEKLTSNANRLFYLALPPNVYQNVTSGIKSSCKTQG